MFCIGVWIVFGIAVIILFLKILIPNAGEALKGEFDV